MSEVAAGTAKAAARRRRSWALGVVGLVAVALLIGNAAGPYLFRGATLQSEIATQVRLTTGLALSARGHARFDLLPVPRIKMSDVHVSDPSGTLTIDAETLRGEVRLLPLLVGRLELASATLVRPKLVIDVEGRAMPPDSLIGRAMHARAGTVLGGDQRLGAVTLVDGSATLVGSGSRRWPRFSSIDLAVDWRDLDSPASLTGTMRVDAPAAAGTVMDLAAWVEQPSALMRGDRSAAALHLHSFPLDLSASGDVTGAAPFGFKGHVSGGAPSLAALLAVVGKPVALPAPFADLAVNSDAAIALDRDGSTTLDLPNLHVSADGNAFEGTLAYRGAGTPLLSGTLATDTLSLRPFLARLPPLLGPGRAGSKPAGSEPAGSERVWSTSPAFRQPMPMALQLDLRVSASHLRLPPFVLDDAALSVMTRDDRIEIGLNEGAAYGGALKGRLSVGTATAGLKLRGSGSIEGADASTIGWDLFGRPVASGILSGSGSFESEGATVAALVGGLRGWARGAIGGGDLSGIDLGLGLRAFARGQDAQAGDALKAGRTPFRTLSFDLRLDGGVATLGDASMQGRDASVSAGGSIDLGARSLDLRAVASTPEAAAGPSPPVRWPLAVDGTFDAPVFHAGAAP